MAQTETPGELRLEAASAARLDGTFARNGVIIRFSVRGKDPQQFRLESESSRTIFDGRFSYSKGEATIKLNGGKTVYTIRFKGRTPSGPIKTSGDPGEWHRFARTPYAREIPFLSRSLGAAKVTARAVPQSAPVHILGLHVALVNSNASPIRMQPPPGREGPQGREGPRGEDIPGAPATQPPSGYFCVALNDDQNRDPNRDGCYGMCGNGCECWDWVCGDCCCHIGCRAHDEACRACSSADISECIKCYSYEALKAPWTCDLCGNEVKKGCAVDADCGPGRRCDAEQKECVVRQTAMQACRRSTDCTPQPAACLLYQRTQGPSGTELGGTCPAIGPIPQPWTGCACAFQ